MKRAGFVLDLDRCTGCGACAFACRIENGLAEGTSHREVTTFNPERLPEVPVLHLSLACNHCGEPACMAACPAAAFSRHAGTGAVKLHAERCIGCGYCAWVCPYGAPRPDPAARVMTKCTLCLPRLERGGTPACVTACPVAALGLAWGDGAAPPAARVPGLPETGLRPALETALRRRIAAMEPAAHGGRGPSAARDAARPDWSRLRGHWPLAAFTLAMPALAAWYASPVLGGPPPSPPAFVALAAAAFAASVLHLGRPERAWRAASNLRTSWLSREVVLLGAFAALAAAQLALLPAARGLAWTAVALSAAGLAAMDRLYRVPGQESPTVPHSAMGTLTALYLAGLLSGVAPLALLAGAAKLGLYLARHAAGVAGGPPTDGGATDRTPARLALPALRVVLGFAIPAAEWTFAGRPPQAAGFAAALAGEVVDRLEFYAGLGFLTPRLQAARDLAAMTAPRRAAPGSTAPPGHAAPIGTAPIGSGG